MTSPEYLKPIGTIAIVLPWIVIGFVINKWPGTKDMSISKHAAAHKSAYKVMAVFQTIDLPIFLFFVYKWFVPTYQINKLFTLSIGLAVLGLLIAAWIPDTKGIQSKVHSICAYGAALMFIPATFLIGLSPEVSTFARTLSIVTTAYMIICTLSFIFYKKSMKYHLYLQGIYIILFQLSILSVIYIT